ncbi:CAZyme family GT1 [Paecilomyces variotii]|nr:CAZyme family GT1 [Paecilomyces variotii]KAJ9397984.1 CAZyme family GT1 [Paecilomyces variotii]
MPPSRRGSLPSYESIPSIEYSPYDTASNNPPCSSDSHRSMVSLPEVSSTNNGRIDVRVGSRCSQDLELLMSHQVPENYQTNETPTNGVPIWDIKLNIVIQVVGSRGDVQPFIALGNELQKFGHRVRLATHAIFEDFVTKAGLEFYSIGGDPVELMSYMVRNPGLIPSMKVLRAGEIQQKRTTLANILDGCWRSCIEPDSHSHIPFVADAIIANPPSFAHIHCAQALDIPVHLMFTMPWTSTRAFPHPLANLKYSGKDHSLGNLISYHFVEWVTWQGLGDLVNKWRRTVLGLPQIPATEGPNLAETLNVPFTYCWSPALIPKPGDWGPNVDVSGFFFRDPPFYEPPSELREFLHAGASPVYIGFGSIVLEDPEKMLSIIFDAVRKANVRAIISYGWANVKGPKLSHVHYLGDCPHEWLFQHVVAVVHHGGAGTTACGLRNGKPTAIIPFFGDQPFWGNMVAAVGAGPKPIPHKDLTGQKLAEAITYCLTDKVMSAARRIARNIKQECGVRAAVNSFHSHLPQHTMRCDLISGQPAVWEMKRGKKTIQLSNLAACCLKNQGYLHEKNLKRHKTKSIFIDIRRWDPVTAISSASLSAVTEIVDATVGIFRDPYREFKRHREKQNTATSDMDSNKTGASAGGEYSGYGKDMALASVISFGKFLGRTSRGALVDLPLAAVEGMRAVPRLYGENVRDNHKATDWKSGMRVAGSAFVHGLHEGVTDIFVYTYHGKREQGTIGVAKGLTKGLLSLTLKTGAATMGLVAYSNQGIYHSLRTAMKQGLTEKVEQARWVEAEYMMRMEGNLPAYVQEACGAFDALMVARDT